jgi:hypothetical protein
MTSRRRCSSSGRRRRERHSLAHGFSSRVAESPSLAVGVNRAVTGHAMNIARQAPERERREVHCRTGIAALILCALLSASACEANASGAANSDASTGDSAPDGAGSGGSSSSSSGGQSSGAAQDGASGSDTGADGAIGSGTCVEAPTLAPSDLSCNSDEDCTSVWSGTICPCGCNCGRVPGNTAANARVGSALSSLPSCSGPPDGCECPAGGLPRCVAHQCALCYDMPNQPAACDQDAAVGD